MRRLVVLVLAVVVIAVTSDVPAEASVSGDDGLIAFVSGVSGVSQIYVVEVDGSGLRQITSFGEDLSHPSVGWLDWSPDGTRLAFGVTGSDPVYPAGVWVINVDGTGLEFVTAGGSPSWSPDGRRLAFSKDAFGQVNGLATSVIATIDLASREEMILTDPGDWVHPSGNGRTTRDRRPVWAPDGSSIFFLRHYPGSASISSDAIFEVEISDGSVRSMGGGGGGGNIPDLDVGPAGDVLIRNRWMITSPWGSPYLVEVAVVEGGTSRTVDTPSGYFAGGGVSYAPSGRGFAVDLFAAEASGTSGIWVSDGEGSWRFVTEGTHPAWQPVNPYPMGLVDPATGEWHLRDATGVVESFYYGNPGDTPFMGDWDCNGTDTPGLYRQSDGYVYLRDSNRQGAADIRFFFGNPGDVPIAGDFNGDLCDTVSIYRPSNQTFYIINRLGTSGDGLGVAEYSYVFGNPGDKPFVGDFDGDGVETVGLHRESTGLVYYRNTHTQGIADNQFIFGNPGDRFVAGDWNRDGTDTPAVYRPSNTTHYFRFVNTQGNADAHYIWGQPTWLPVTGNYTHNTTRP